MTPAGLHRLCLDEATPAGPELHAYGDPLTHGAPWTIGWGTTGPEVGPETVWTLERCIEMRDVKIAGIMRRLSDHISNWRSLDPIRRDVLTNMAYQMGFAGLLKFRRTIWDVETGLFQKAGMDMLGSDWAKRETPARASRLAAAMVAPHEGWPGVGPMPQAWTGASTAAVLD